MPQYVKIPDGCKAVLVSDKLIRRAMEDAGPDGWSPAIVAQVRWPETTGAVVDPQFRYVEFKSASLR